MNKSEPNFSTSITLGKSYYDAFSTTYLNGYVYLIHLPSKQFVEVLSTDMFAYARMFWRLFTGKGKVCVAQYIQNLDERKDPSDWAVRFSRTLLSKNLIAMGYTFVAPARAPRRLIVNGHAPYEKKFYKVVDRELGFVRHLWVPAEYTRNQILTLWSDTFRRIHYRGRRLPKYVREIIKEKAMLTHTAAELEKTSKSRRFSITACDHLYEKIPLRGKGRSCDIFNYESMINFANSQPVG